VRSNVTAAEREMCAHQQEASLLIDRVFESLGERRERETSSTLGFRVHLFISG